MDFKEILHSQIAQDSDSGMSEWTGLNQGEIAVGFVVSDLFLFVVNLIADKDADIPADMLDLLMDIEYSGVTVTTTKAENLAKVLSYVWSTEVSYLGESTVDECSASDFSVLPTLEFKMSAAVLANMDAEYRTV